MSNEFIKIQLTQEVSPSDLIELRINLIYQYTERILESQDRVFIVKGVSIGEDSLLIVEYDTEALDLIKKTPDELHEGLVLTAAETVEVHTDELDLYQDTAT